MSMLEQSLKVANAVKALQFPIEQSKEMTAVIVAQAFVISSIVSEAESCEQNIESLTPSFKELIGGVNEFYTVNIPMALTFFKKLFSVKYSLVTGCIDLGFACAVMESCTAETEVSPDVMSSLKVWYGETSNIEDLGKVAEAVKDFTFEKEGE